MITITQLIFIKPGQEKVFNEFEKIVLPLMEKYGGKLLFRQRPNQYTVIETNIGLPYEIHIVQFNDEEGLNDFMNDETRQKVLHLKEISIENAVMYKAVD